MPDNRPYDKRGHRTVFERDPERHKPRNIVPDDIRMEKYHEPCFKCGAARECEHRG